MRGKSIICKKKNYNQHLTLAKIKGKGIPLTASKCYPPESKMEKLSLDFLNTLLLTPDNVAVVMKTGSLMMWEVTITYEEKSTTFEIHNKNVKPQMGAVYGEKGDLMKELSAFLPSCPSVFIFVLLSVKCIQSRNGKKKIVNGTKKY